MKQWAVCLFTMAIAVAALTFSIKNKPPRIGFAETPVLLAGFTEAIEARKEFETAQKEWEKNLKTINDSLVASMNRMKQGFEKAPKDKQDQMRKELQRWDTDLSRYSQAVKKMSEEKEKQLMEPVVNKMNAYLKQWGASQGFDMIFGTMTGGNILQADDAHNVTSRFLADLNKQYESKPRAKADSSVRKQ